MKKTLLLLLSVLWLLSAFSSVPRWIGAPAGAADTINSWTAFRRDVQLDEVPLSAVARIAVDSKYWLWVNGAPVVREGGLKRGPAPADGFCDEVDLAPYLKRGVHPASRAGLAFRQGGLFAQVERPQRVVLRPERRGCERYVVAVPPASGILDL